MILKAVTKFAPCGVFAVAFALTWGVTVTLTLAAEPTDAALGEEFEREVQPRLARHCYECHGKETAEAEIDLTQYTTLADVRQAIDIWQKMRVVLDEHQMPPPEADELKDEDRRVLLSWVRGVLQIEASKLAGDPGPVVLRRLNNAEFTYTIRDLTGIQTLDPAAEFPVDGAAGEGFTNTGDALSMSPALVAKYLDAAKEISSHLVLLPDDIRFSPASTRRDWTDESLRRIREFYGRFTDLDGASTVNLQGIAFETNQGGRIPYGKYFAALMASRDQLRAGSTTLAEVAEATRLNAKYLTRLWETLETPQASLLLAGVQNEWQSESSDEAAAMEQFVLSWQQSLWKFNTVGHLGREGAPTQWLEAVDPTTTSQEIRAPLEAVDAEFAEVTIEIGGPERKEASSQATYDAVIQHPRLVAAGRPDIPLKELPRVWHRRVQRRERLVADADACLRAAQAFLAASVRPELSALASQHSVQIDVLAAWFEYLGLQSWGEASTGPLLAGRIERADAYDFVKGWSAENALSVVANSSDTTVRIPGVLEGHSIAAHPAPDRSVGVAWRAATARKVAVQGIVQHAHVECGNGVAWTVELRRGSSRRVLAEGTSQREAIVPFGPFHDLAVDVGDLVVLLIHPQDGNHSCDLTHIDLTVADEESRWSLSEDVTADILIGNPHPDQNGVADVWTFFSEPVTRESGSRIPPDALLTRWLNAADADKPALRQAVVGLLDEASKDWSAARKTELAEGDREMLSQVISLSGPLVAASSWNRFEGDRLSSRSALHELKDSANLWVNDDAWQSLLASEDPDHWAVPVGTRFMMRLPASLVAGYELLATASLRSGPSAGSERDQERWAQVYVGPNEVDARRWPDPGLVLLVTDQPDARANVERACDEFRQLFPAAACYPTIVPVDEVVTMTLFHREDEHLQRLMLNDSQRAELDQMWAELQFVSQEPLLQVTAYEQIVEFATQDRPDLVVAFASLRDPILAAAEAFRERLRASEPGHVNRLIEFADRAWRRPLKASEQQELRAFYQLLRREELPHEQATQLLLVRILTSPVFLYRLEEPAGPSTVSPVSAHELASRLSYFLWSSLPDDELRRCADSGELLDPLILKQQTRRMLRDARTRRLAIHFGCQWLHVRDFDVNDEKNEALFPEFAEHRADMYEESVQLFSHVFRQDAPILDLYVADYTFLNERLAKFYGIAGVEGDQWRRVDGVNQWGRGGILSLASVLAKQSGASRTSPILRGNWVSETLLGERLPRPPANVPQLPEELPKGLTARQLIERHSADESCARCHARIDPYGFSLEQYDAIGRLRPIPQDTSTTLLDGVQIEGWKGLKDYLSGPRRERVIDHFCRKLLGYALGRSVRLSDEPLLAEIDQQLAREDYRFSTAVEAIVLSRQFREKGSLEDPKSGVSATTVAP